LITIVQRIKATDNEIWNPVDVLTIVIESLDFMQATLLGILNSVLFMQNIYLSCSEI
jgi:hypothetical protein